MTKLLGKHKNSFQYLFYMEFTQDEEKESDDNVGGDVECESENV